MGAASVGGQGFCPGWPHGNGSGLFGILIALSVDEIHYLQSIAQAG